MRPLLEIVANIAVKQQSHGIVRFLDPTIGCDLANGRPIGNVCYDLQKHTAIGFFWMVVGHRTIGRTRGRAMNNDWRRSMARSIVS